MTRRECLSRLPLGLALAGSAQSQDVTMTKIAVAAQRTFGLNLLRGLVARKAGENVFISPISVFLALQMTADGAAGSTLTAMRKALALPNLPATEIDASSAALQNALKARVTIASALWADRHFPLAPAFVKLCGSVFNARAASLNFADPKAAAEINDWVKTNTNGKIDQIVTPDVVRGAAVILTNAVYFAAQWSSEFPASNTTDAPFHKTSGAIKTVSMMHQPRLTGAYRSGSNFDGALLDYKASTVFFYALLPHAGTTPKDALAALDLEHLTGAPADFDLDLKLPRITLDFSASLAEDLKKMGMDVAFHYPQADFLPMGSKKFYISDVLHKTRLEVDEKGTVAAAATAVIMMAGAMMMHPRPVKTLVFDRPFAVVIGDSRTGAVLFAGVIEDP